VAGFDCFYALLDVDFDRREGLKSVATAFGERGAIWAARVLHLATLALLIWVGVLLDIGILYWLGVIAVAALLIYEHALVRPGQLRRLDTAFFLMNGIISVTFFVFVLLDSLF
jgi:4-hydroxybenzoate polyprenyltransferase